MSAQALADPTETSSVKPQADRLFLSRIPIYDAKYAPVGYEMRLNGAKNRAQHAAFFFDAFTSMPAEQILGTAMAFLYCEWDEVVPDFEEILDPKRIVIDLGTPKPGQAAATMLENLDSLRKRGFRVAIGEYALNNDLRNLLPKADFLKIDTRRIDPMILQVLPQRLSKLPSLKVIATHIATPELMQTMVAAGYHAFQGSLDAQKVDSKVKSIDSSRQSILMLMKQVQQEADASDMETSLKRDPGLSFNLLRYVNSAAFAHRGQTTSLSHAIQFLGHQKFYRWLCMRLMSSGTNPAQGLLLRAALTRGRLMELLATECTPRLSPDDAFLTGVFSMLDKLLGVSLQEALNGIQLPPSVIEALEQEDGSLGKLLVSAAACELPDDAVMLTYEHELGIEGLLPMAHLNAIQWAESIISI